MSFMSLRYFLAVAKQLNITETAKSLYITQQTLSSHIINLEKQYGVKLFNRRPKLSLTPAGERMMNYASRIVNLERMMSAEMHDLAKKDGGTLIVGFSRIRARHYFPKIWAEYQLACPNVNVLLVDTIRETDLLRSLQTHSVDLCFNFTPKNSEYLTQQELIQEDLYFVVSKSLFHQHFGTRATELIRQFSKEGIDPLHAADFALILLPSTNIVRQKVNFYFECADIIPHPMFESNDSDLILEMCTGTPCCSFMTICNLFLPLESCQQKLQNVYFFPAKGLKLQTFITYLSDMTPPSYLQKFINICSSTAKSYNHAMLSKRATIEATWCKCYGTVAPPRQKKALQIEAKP